MKEKPKTVTPKLRFPEFKDGPGWEEKPFADLYAFKPTNTLSRDKLNYKNGSIRNIHYGDIHTRFQTLFDIKRELVPFVTNGSADDFDDDSFCAEGDLVLADASEDLDDVGKNIEVVALHGERVLSGTHTILATRRDARIIVGFGGYLFRSERVREQIRREAQGAKVYGISSGRLANVNVCFPAKEAEQRKIADCLMSLDEWITAEGRKLEALRAHKKGLMQQLFPREGESRPRLRFPEFRHDPEWEAKRTGDMEPFVTSGSRGWAAYYADRGSLFVRITNLSRESIFLDLTDSKFVNLPPEAREGVRTQLKAHDVLVSVTADIGIIGYVDERVPSPAFINQHIALVRFDTPSVCAKFVAYLLASDNSQSRFRASTDNGTKPGMNLMAVQNMPLSLPAVTEQQRIAACLSSLDALIAAQSRKLESFRVHKKALMQQLFPSPEGCKP